VDSVSECQKWIRLMNTMRGFKDLGYRIRLCAPGRGVAKITARRSRSLIHSRLCVYVCGKGGGISSVCL